MNEKNAAAFVRIFSFLVTFLLGFDQNQKNINKHYCRFKARKKPSEIFRFVFFPIIIVTNF